MSKSIFSFRKKNDSFLHRKRMSPRKLLFAQGTVFPRAVFNPPRVGLYIPSEARAVTETQGGVKDRPRIHFCLSKKQLPRLVHPFLI